MKSILDKILDIADYPTERRLEFKESINKVLIIKIIEALSVSNPVLYQELVSAISENTSNSEKIDYIFNKISESKEDKIAVYSAIDPVLTDLVTVIAESASEDQKQQILASLPN